MTAPETGRAERAPAVWRSLVDVPGAQPDPSPPERVRCGDDELVRTAMLMPDWPDVGKRARAELAALYADEGLSDRQFATRLAGVIAADDVLADLVAVAELRSGGGEQPRDVLDVQGGGAPPYVWRCDEPDCTTAVPGTYSRAATGPNCSAHPALVLRRTP